MLPLESPALLRLERRQEAKEPTICGSLSNDCLDNCACCMIRRHRARCLENYGRLKMYSRTPTLFCRCSGFATVPSVLLMLRAWTRQRVLSRFLGLEMEVYVAMSSADA